jgi:saccharopine dehydrogenase-like NADP-dependent oxidoreductase
MNTNGYVTKISKEIVVQLTNQATSHILTNAGFAPGSNSEYSISIADEPHKIATIKLLQSNDFAFSAGSGWSPSELFEYYRKQNLLSGTYKRISWTDPNTTRVVTA